MKSSTLQLLRFHFSFFLMPVYWFALSQTKDINANEAALVFIILHLLVYPASNGYNSYMDRDKGSIGGLKDPKQPTKQLFYVTIVLDIVALISAILISWYFFAGIFAYIFASRAYSYRGIRLKKYPVTGYLTVIICQGGLTFFLVAHGSSEAKTLEVPLAGMISASLLVGGFYPLTQIYQHEQDRLDHVTTLSYKLGYKGTFIFTSLVYMLAMAVIGLYMNAEGKAVDFFITQIFLLPVLAYFAWWFYKVCYDHGEANFKNTMRMNLIGSFFTNAAFIFLLLMKKP